MDCPKCGERFSVTVGPIVHGEQVKRNRHCVKCKAEWATVEITRREHTRLRRAEAARLQFTQMLGEK